MKREGPTPRGCAGRARPRPPSSPASALSRRQPVRPVRSEFISFCPFSGNRTTPFDTLTDRPSGGVDEFGSPASSTSCHTVDDGGDPPDDGRKAAQADASGAENAEEACAIEWARAEGAARDAGPPDCRTAAVWIGHFRNAGDARGRAAREAGRAGVAKEGHAAAGDRALRRWVELCGWRR